ncbi:MAG: hypothetical protein II332_01540, partial [Kiritimatiellae bacterium]|nr:hypothetical protein [Kiritimatiellia bacterium]
IWDPVDQVYSTTLYYAGDEYDEYGMMEARGATPGSWIDMATLGNSDLTLRNGDAFWIDSSTVNAQAIITGEVPTTANTITIIPGFNMVANPYPKAVKVNDLFSISGLKGLDWGIFEELGDTLEIWDPVDQVYSTTLYYAGDEYDEYGMMEARGATPGSWIDMATLGNSDIEIPAGGAFWVNSKVTATLTFK